MIFRLVYMICLCWCKHVFAPTHVCNYLHVIFQFVNHKKFHYLIKILTLFSILINLIAVKFSFIALLSFNWSLMWTLNWFQVLLIY